MSNPKISLIKSGSRNSWQSNFATQAWSNVRDYTGGIVDKMNFIMRA